MSGIPASLIVLLVAVFASQPGASLKNTANCNLDVAVKKCVKSGFLLQTLETDKLRLPTTLAEVNELCGQVKTGEECAKMFIDQCHDSFTEKQALGHTLEGVFRLFKRLCKTNAKKNELLRNVSTCGNAVLADGTQCLNNYKRVLVAAEKSNDKDKMLKMMCCKVHDMAPCVKARMLEKGERVCSSSNIEYMRKLENSFRNELTEVICVDYEKNSANCLNAKYPELSNSGNGAENISIKSMIVSLKNIADKVLNH